MYIIFLFYFSREKEKEKAQIKVFKEPRVVQNSQKVTNMFVTF